jgi:signal transduction histidine kinase
VTSDRLDRDRWARGFVRAAQYLANVLADADLLGEATELVRSTFAPDVVCFCRGGESADCPASPEDRLVLRRAIAQVMESGLMAIEELREPDPTATVILPVTARGRTEVALVVGFRGERELPAHVLDALLGVAGLVGATLARQRADREVLALAEERAARAVAESTERQARLVSEATRSLVATFDSDAALAALARLLVPQLADWCAVELRDADGGAPGREVAVVHHDPGAASGQRELGPRTDGEPAPRAAAVLATGRPELHGEVPPASLAEWARDPEHQGALRSLGVASGIVVPMASRGEVLGAITLGSSSRRYGPEDLALAEELGRRAGAALENARLYQQAQQAIHARDQFLAVASHELKTPLTALTLVIDGVQRSIDRIPDAPERMRAKLGILSRQSRRLAQLVSDLLDVSRIQAGRLDVHLAEVDLAALVREVVERHEQDALAAGCAIELVAAEPVVGTWDGSRVDQVVSNLLSNAFKYGGGKPVSIVVQAAGDAARLSIADQGVGIAPDDHERVFQLFERAVASSTTPGMGLGLWITKQIVTRLGGSIRLESDLGRGARFVVELPARPVASA